VNKTSATSVQGRKPEQAPEWLASWSAPTSQAPVAANMVRGLQTIRLALLIGMSSCTVAPDPWRVVRAKDRATSLGSRSRGGRKLSMEEAKALAVSALMAAEAERLQYAEEEAARSFWWE
jgi:hypothetical protein